MPSLSRRAFLGTSLGSLAAPYSLAGHHNVLGVPGSAAHAAPTAPDTLFLTWQRDPTTTMTIQWVGPKSVPADAVITYAPAAPHSAVWQVKHACLHDYPLTDLKVHRVELDHLAPGKDYQFRVGRGL